MSNGRNLYFAAAGVSGGLIGGILTGLIPPWAAWSAAGACMGFVGQFAVAPEKRTFARSLLTVLVTTAFACCFALLIYR